MYAAYFGLQQEPFSIAPDPRLLFMSDQHREALAHLLYGVQGGGGFVLLTGDIGTGKTTVCRSFLEQVPAHCNLAYIFNPKLTVLELLETVCHEFGVAVPGDPAQRTVKDYLDPFNAFLLQAHAQGRNNVLVIDEAQNLAPEVLEQLRLLTNLETSERKLLQIVLIGQPELRDMLARPDLEQLAQRVIARYHLRSLSEAETGRYVRHRMEACGLKGPLPLEPRALRHIHAAAGGVPRRINLLCDRALLGAYAGGHPTVTAAIVRKAAAEVFPDPTRRAGTAGRPGARLALAALGGVAAGAALLAGASLLLQPRPEELAFTELVTAPAALPAAAASGPATDPAPAANPPAATPPRLLREEAAAWRELAQAWKVTAPVEGDPCEALARQGLQCFSRPLSLALIRQLGRPGIVTLDAATGQPSYAILTGLTDQAATLRAAGTEQVVSLSALAQRWQGDFATLWRSPEGYSDRSRDRAGGSAGVQWVAQRLAVLRQLPAPTGPQPLDAALKSQVRAFQLAQGLQADGLPGPMTYMQLNRASGIDEPRLRTEP